MIGQPPLLNSLNGYFLVSMCPIVQGPEQPDANIKMLIYAQQCICGGVRRPDTVREWLVVLQYRVPQARRRGDRGWVTGAEETTASFGKTCMQPKKAETITAKLYSLAPCLHQAMSGPGLLVTTNRISRHAEPATRAYTYSLSC